ncbi:MAG: MarR family transcriptional regulator [Deltaproteobacteria bacterium]|nr:MAG: MarR family transcriptional regulator [Deltaproteobacteria bacterium]
MKKKKLIMHGKFQSIMRLSQQLEKAPKKFGTNELLSHSEIHLIEIIGDNDQLSVTDISKVLDITKGAVSQSLKRLEAKGLTAKETDPDNLSRSIVKLTSKGQTAYWAHKHWHETMDGGFAQYMNKLGPKEHDIIVYFLEKVEDFLKRRVVAKE